MLIKLKDEMQAEGFNRVLKDMSLDRARAFVTEKDNQSWLDDINQNQNSPQRLLKPADRDLTMEELKKLFPVWTETGLLEADLDYGRTSEADMQKLASFICTHQDEIAYVTDSDTLLERGSIEAAMHPIIEALESEPEEPEMLPEEEQSIPDLESGHLLAKSFSRDPFWVIYGNVERPTFLKKRLYKEEVYNDLYRDKKGFAYLLMPLHDFSPGFGEKVFDEAYQIGLREEPHFFLHYLYNYPYADLAGVARSLHSFYTVEELEQRLKMSLKKMKSELELLYRKHHLTVVKGILKTPGTKEFQTSLQGINALLMALKEEKTELIDWRTDGGGIKLLFAKKKNVQEMTV